VLLKVGTKAGIRRTAYAVGTLEMIGESHQLFAEMMALG
jgi:hypothetical protein